MIRSDELQALMFERQAAAERAARLYARLREHQEDHRPPRFEISRRARRWLSWLPGLAGASADCASPAPSSSRRASAK